MYGVLDDSAPGTMVIPELVREIIASAWAQRISTALVAVLVGAMCVTTALTVGRSAAARAEVGARLDAAGSRALEVVDVKDQAFITPSVIRLVDGLGSVERVVGLSASVDVRNSRLGADGAPVAAWTVEGDPAAAVRLVEGRWPGPGEAVVSLSAQRTLGLDEPVGAVRASSGAEYPVVGRYVPRTPFDELGSGLVIAGTGTPVRTLQVVVRDAAGAQVTQRAVLALLARPDVSDVQLTSPVTLAELERTVLGDLGSFGRGLLVLVLGAGGVLVTVVVLADVLMRRVDLGRRRALGAPRWVIIAIVVGRTVVAAVVGALVGTGAAGGALLVLGQPFDAVFAASTAVLAVLVAACAAAAPAVAAAVRDPVRVLRTP